VVLGLPGRRRHGIEAFLPKKIPDICQIAFAAVSEPGCSEHDTASLRTIEKS